jgi:uncharacterized Rmd1/YagE family protein
MNEKMRAHIETLFENAPKTRKAYELKEELLTNSEERYQDLVANGVSQEDAFKHVVSSIGNVTELFQGLEEANEKDRLEVEERLNKNAVMKSIAIGLYIFGVVVFFGCAFTGVMTAMGFVLMLLIDIIPTCMLIYIGARYPKYMRKEDTIVEEFKEWKSDALKNKSIKSAALVVLWTFILLIYFAVSFITFAWYATWIIFLAGACLHAIVELLFRLKEMKK